MFPAVMSQGHPPSESTGGHILTRITSAAAPTTPSISIVGTATVELLGAAPARSAAARAGDARDAAAADTDTDTTAC